MAELQRELHGMDLGSADQLDGSGGPATPRINLEQLVRMQSAGSEAAKLLLDGPESFSKEFLEYWIK